MPKKRWYGEPGRRTRYYCTHCMEDLDYASIRQAAKYHLVSNASSTASLCQGQLARLRDVDLRNTEVAARIEGQLYYGRVVYEDPELVYEDPGRAITTYRVQFTDGDEYEFGYEQVLSGQQLLRDHPPPIPIEIPLDRGVDGHDGKLVGELDELPRTIEDQNVLEQAEEEELDEEDDADAIDDWDEVSIANFSSSDDLNSEDEEYLAEPVIENGNVNIFSHIFRTLEDKAPSQSNISVIRGFARETEDFGTKLPKHWDTVLKLLKVRSLQECERGMCIHGHHVWPYLAENEFEYNSDDVCPYNGCGEPRFELRGGKLYHRRVLWYLGLASIFVDYFQDPAWAAVWKQGIDISDNGVWAFEQIKAMNEHFQGKVLRPDAGLYSAWDDAFTMCANGTNGITLFGTQSSDVPNSHFAQELNRRTFMVVTPPEPPTTSLIMDEVIDDVNKLQKEGVLVKHPYEDRDFLYYPFLDGWGCDAKARKLMLNFGGPGRYLGCLCRQRATYIVGTTWYYGGYAFPVSQADMTNADGSPFHFYAGALEVQRYHHHFVSIMETMKQVEKAIEEGERGALARLDDIKTFQGCSSAHNYLLRLDYIDLKYFCRAAICHQFLLGLVKADFYPAIYQLLGSGVVAQKWMRRAEERGKMITRPSELQRSVKPLLPATVSPTTPPMSGHICEDIWSHIESTGLLTVCNHSFDDHEQKLLLEQGVSEEIVQHLPSFKTVMLRLISAALFCLRDWADLQCTAAMEEAQPGTLARVNEKIAYRREMYKVDIRNCATLQEIVFPHNALSSNLHHAVCQIPLEMDYHGATRPELGIERTIGKVKGGKRGTSKHAQTLVGDVLLEQRMRQLRYHPLFQPREADITARKYGRDGHGPGYKVTDVRMLGRKSDGQIHGVDVATVRSALVRLISCIGVHDDGEWPIEVLGHWSQIAIENCHIELYSYASITSGSLPRLEAAFKSRRDVDNSWFSVGRPRTAHSKEGMDDVPTQSLESGEGTVATWPGDREKLQHDYDNVTVVCNANAFFVAVPPGGQLKPLRGALGDVYKVARMVSPRYTNVWKTCKIDAYKDEAVLLDCELKKLAKLEVPLSISVHDASQLGMNAGDIELASVHARMYPRER